MYSQLYVKYHIFALLTYTIADVGTALFLRFY